MLYSFQLNTAPLESARPVFLDDGDRSYKFFMGKNETQHLYTNIPVNGAPVVRYDSDHTLTELSLADEIYMTEDQIDSNQSLTNDRNVSYRITVAGTPRQAIVTFPAYRGDRGWSAPYGVLRAERFQMDNTLYISFQDPYFTAGSYFLSDNFGNDPLPTAVEVIKETLENFSLSGEDTTFVGASKGANIAALVSRYFENNQLILCNYAVDIGHWVKNTGLSHLDVALKFYDRTYPDALSILRSESSQKETHWLYSIGDDIANKGSEQLVGRHLTTYASSEPHGTVLLREWDTILDIVRRRYESR